MRPSATWVASAVRARTAAALGVAVGAAPDAMVLGPIPFAVDTRLIGGTQSEPTASWTTITTGSTIGH
jgi:hypothetical protein